MTEYRRKHGQDESKVFDRVQTHMTENRSKICSGDRGNFGVFGAIGKSHEDAFADEIVEEG